MSLIRRTFFAPVVPDIFGATVLQPVLAVIGVFTFLAGAIYLPTLAPSRGEYIFSLFLLASVALLCTVVGQLAAVIKRLDALKGKNAYLGSEPNR